MKSLEETLEILKEATVFNGELCTKIHGPKGDCHTCALHVEICLECKSRNCKNAVASIACPWSGGCCYDDKKATIGLVITKLRKRKLAKLLEK